MGRPRTTPEDAKAVSAKLPPALQIALHQLALNRWTQSGRKPEQNELFIEAVKDFLKIQGIDVSQIEKATAHWERKRAQSGTIATFPKKPRGGRRT
jgi:hypothetical protein